MVQTQLIIVVPWKGIYKNHQLLTNLYKLFAIYCDYVQWMHGKNFMRAMHTHVLVTFSYCNGPSDFIQILGNEKTSDFVRSTVLVSGNIHVKGVKSDAEIELDYRLSKKRQYLVLNRLVCTEIFCTIADPKRKIYPMFAALVTCRLCLC